MATTYTLIASNTLGSAAATVTFSSIPSTYTDLIVRIGARTDRASTLDYISVRFNNDSATNYSITWLEGDGSTPASSRASTISSFYQLPADAASATGNTFSECEIYIPNYTVSANKQVNLIGSQENNNANNRTAAIAGLWRNTNAINSIAFTSFYGNNFVTNSSFYLYGIKNS